jgi:uncharacterized protein (DUF58 family)
LTSLANWLETRWATPAYSGWVLAGIALCFFMAAANTMAGWLYVLSGTILALLVLGAIFPLRSLRQIKIHRLPTTPISAGDTLMVELAIENASNAPKTLLQVRDLLPYVLSQPMQTAVEMILPGETHRWVYYVTANRRGIYRWHELELRTGTPLGLFWCRRSRKADGKAIVYPQILPLTHCPLIDSLGQDDRIDFQSNRRYQAATEGITRSLRPYRYGDPTRLIHWRVSARFDEFVVRELEIVTGGQEVIIALDSASRWEEENFEQAAIAAASLYFYASRSQLEVKLWTAGTGLVRGNRVVLETLAAVTPQEEPLHSRPTLPLIWLTQDSTAIDSLPAKSRWVFFPGSSSPSVKSDRVGLVVNLQQPLQQQLQTPLQSRVN